MKNIYTFDDFVNESDNNNNKSNIYSEKDINMAKEAIEKMSDEDKKKLNNDIDLFAKKLNLTREDLKNNPKKTEEALSKLKGISHIAEGYEYNLNEGVLSKIKDVYNSVKNSFWNAISWIGAGSSLIGAITSVIGLMTMPNIPVESYYNSDPNSALVVGGVSLAVGLITWAIGSGADNLQNYGSVFK